MSAPSTDLELFVPCAPGLEPLLRRECTRIAGRKARVKTVVGGVSCRGDLATAMALNLECGLGIRVVARVASFQARRFSDIAAGVKRVDWKPWLPVKGGVEVKATAKKSKLLHTGAIAERVLTGIGASDGVAAMTVFARMHRDVCTISVDLSGEPLHRRGWRQATAKAPLREDLARALLVVSGWKPGTVLVDPLMGAGTIVIEAATMARRLAPGYMRSFALQGLRSFDPAAWTDVRERAHRRALDDTDVSVYGRDRNGGALKAAVTNANLAGVLGSVDLQRVELADGPWPDNVAAVATNPPYGHRLGGASATFELLDSRLKELAPGTRVAAIAPARARGQFRLRCIDGESALMTDHGGIKIVLLTGEIQS